MNGILRKIIHHLVEEYDPYDKDSWVDDDNEPVDEPNNPNDILDDSGRYFTSEGSYSKFRDELDQSEGPKPVGLWYSCGTEWIDHLRGNLRVPYPDRYENEQFIYEIQPIHAKMLVIRDNKQFLQFTEEFGYEDSNEMIRWDLVAAQYAGIEICPHLSKMKVHPWYASWDVASGCIWSHAAVDWIKLAMQRDSDGYWETANSRLFK